MRLIRGAALYAEAVLALTVASLLVRSTPNKKVARLLGRIGDPAPEPPLTAPMVRAAAVGLAVERTAKLLPWKPVCLPQAVATRAMLRRRALPSTGHLGITGTKPLRAHAWVTVADRVVQGGPVDGATELARLR